MSTPETGRRQRRGGEARPSDLAPEDEAPVGPGEAEIGVTEGVYFTKVANKERWHAFDEEDEPIGSIYRDADERWKVKAYGVILPTNHGSAASARAFLAGYVTGHNLGYAAGRLVGPIDKPEDGHVETSRGDEPGEA